MSITTLIDQIDTLVTKGAPLSQIKGLLVTVREQAEALDARVSRLEAEAQDSVSESVYKDVVADRDEIKKDRDLFREELEGAKKKIVELDSRRAAPRRVPSVILSDGRVRHPRQ